MNIILGGMIYVAALFAAKANLEGQIPFIEPKNHQVVPNFGWIPRQSRPERKKVAQAVTLEAVTMQGCPPCKRLKAETIPNLVMMGYDVIVANRITDTRNTTRFPTLYYLDANGNVVYKHVGFQTTEEVLKRLKKRK